MKKKKLRHEKKLCLSFFSSYLSFISQSKVLHLCLMFFSHSNPEASNEGWSPLASSGPPLVSRTSKLNKNQTLALLGGIHIMRI